MSWGRRWATFFQRCDCFMGILFFRFFMNAMLTESSVAELTWSHHKWNSFNLSSFCKIRSRAWNIRGDGSASHVISWISRPFFLIILAVLIDPTNIPFLPWFDLNPAVVAHFDQRVKPDRIILLRHITSTIQSRKCSHQRQRHSIVRSTKIHINELLRGVGSHNCRGVIFDCQRATKLQLHFLPGLKSDLIFCETN